MNIKCGHIAYTADNMKKEFIFKSTEDNDDLKVIFTDQDIENGQRVRVDVLCKKNIELNDIYLETDERINHENLVYLNGYQTWTDSREFRIDEKIPKLSKVVWGIMNMYGDYGFYKYRKGKLQSWTYTYIRNNGGILLIGSLSEASGYTVFEYESSGKLKIKKDCSGLIVKDSYKAFDIYIAEGEENDVFDKYFECMNVPKLRVGMSTGWTSWYNYYTNITEKIILDNLCAFKTKNIPIDIFQIDDGYQHAVGDWLIINEKFPKGMKFIADEIKNCGYKAGLWLAPFICEKRSEVYKKHPDWIVTKAGFNPGWSGNFYVLDFYNEEVKEYIKMVFNTVLNDWNYDMVKLDFLYAAALIQRDDKTRGQIMYEAMSFLRKIAGDKIILGCGVPLGCAFGLTDYCRIGSDVGLKWEDKLLNNLHYRERVSTINALTSTIGRRHLNGRAFYNDPDVFILRSKNNNLSGKQRFTLLLLNSIFGGLVFTSDNIDEYSEDELEIYKSIFPMKKKNIDRVIHGNALKIYFSIDDKKYLAVSNLSNKYASVKLEEGGYFSKAKGFIKGLTEIPLEPYESQCFILTEAADEKLKESNNLFLL